MNIVKFYYFKFNRIKKIMWFLYNVMCFVENLLEYCESECNFWVCLNDFYRSWNDI